MQHTAFELRTAPNSLLETFTIGKTLTEVWAKTAEEIEKSLALLPDEIIMWRLVYNCHEPDEDDESATPQPVITGQVSIITKDTLFLRKACPYSFEFSVFGQVLSLRNNRFVALDEDIVKVVVESLTKD